MLDALATQQARRLHHTITGAGITVHQLWWHYFSLSGHAGPIEVDAYLHQALHLPTLERRLLDHAAHQLLTD